MKSILVTGAAGNIGSSLVIALLKNKNYSVVAIDNLSTGSRDKLPPKTTANFMFLKVDVNNYNEISAVMLKFSFNYVFHFAAVVGVLRTIENPIKVLNDIEGIKNVLNLSKNTGVNRVFYSSSSEVYGEPVFLPQNEETTPLNSKMPYAIVKNVGEAFCKSFSQEYALDYTVFRFFNTYGPNQSKDFVIAKFLNLALSGKEICIYGDGMQTRTFCFIDDNVDTMVKCMEDGLHVNDTLNIGSDIEYTIKELADIIIKLTNSNSKIVKLPPLKEGDMTRRQPDIAKMMNILKRDLISIEQGLEMLILSKNFI